MKTGVFVAFIYSQYHKNIGIINKFDSFMKYFNQNGSDVQLKSLIFVPQNFGCPSTPALKFIPIDFTAPGQGILDQVHGKLASMVRFVSEIRKCRPDFIYLRYPVADPFLFLALKHLKSALPHMKLITEHQTKELFEVRLLKKKLHFFLEYVFGKHIRNMTDGIVSMSQGIAKYEKSQVSSRVKKISFLNLGNSVDLEKTPIRRNKPEYDGTELRLGFVGNLSSWHGIDRLIPEVIRYSGKRSIKLYLVGEGECFDQLKQDLSASDSRKRVIFTGSLAGSELAEFYNSIHIAVSGLAFHRCHMDDGTPLKTREYMAKGIPFILGYNDREIPPRFPYVLRVSPDDKPVDINRLFDFADSVYQGDFMDEMRSFSKENFCFSVKTKKLYHYLKNLV